MAELIAKLEGDVGVGGAAAAAEKRKLATEKQREKRKLARGEAAPPPSGTPKAAKGKAAPPAAPPAAKGKAAARKQTMNEPKLTYVVKGERGREFAQVLFRPAGAKNAMSMGCLAPHRYGLGIITLAEIAAKLVDFGKSTQEVNPAVLKQLITKESLRILPAVACLC